jgi:hypothetical protein
MKEKENGVMEKRSSIEVHMEGSEGKTKKHPDDNRPVRGHYK